MLVILLKMVIVIIALIVQNECFVFRKLSRTLTPLHGCHVICCTFRRRRMRCEPRRV